MSAFGGMFLNIELIALQSELGQVVMYVFGNLPPFHTHTRQAYAVTKQNCEHSGGPVVLCIQNIVVDQLYCVYRT